MLLAVLALLRRAAHELLAILVGRLLDGRVSESLIVGLSPRVVALERSEALSFELRLLLSRRARLGGWHVGLERLLLGC